MEALYTAEEQRERMWKVARVDRAIARIEARIDELAAHEVPTEFVDGPLARQNVCLQRAKALRARIVRGDA